MFKLVIEDDEGNRTIVPVIRDEISIGRRKGNTIRLNERNVSRDHARLLRDDDVVFLEDRDSRYKTLCNGMPIDGKVKFNIGDVFSIGDYALSLQSDAVADIASPAPAPAAKPPPLKKPEGTEIIMTAPGKLVVTSSNFAGQTFALTKPEMLIGRGENCDIIIDHRSVSTRHAKVVRDVSGTYQIVDLDSKNGIKVSGEEYQSIRLKRGDTIEMGHVRFRFVEPGENYVFAPQAMEYDDAFSSASSSTPPWLLPVIGVLLLLFAVGGYVAFGGSSSSVADAETDPPNVVVKKADNVGNIENIIEGARTHIRKGKIDKAIAKLETAKMLSPNSGQTAVIEKMLSDAVIWSSLAKALDMGEDNLKAKRYDQALEKFKEISEDTSTPIYQIMSEKRLPNQAIAGLLKEAKAAGKDGRMEDSKRALHAILLYDSEHTEATKMNNKLKNVALTVAPKKEKELAVKEAEKEKKVAKKKDRIAKKTKKTKKKFEKDPELAASLGRSALDLMVNGNWKGAMSKCREAQKYGYSCTRIYAVSYKNLGNTAKACKYYKKLGKMPTGLDCK